MEQENLHDLAAPYALHALEDEPARAFESHLGTCMRCRDELASFRETVAQLAYASEEREPPAALESRILAAARSERRNVVPLRPRWVLPGAVAAVAAVAALAFWGTSLNRSLSHQQSAQDRDARILAVLSDKDSRHIPISGASGSLVVAPTRNAVLVVNGLATAPPGQTYEAWIVTRGQAQRAGIFRGGPGRKFALLSRPVPANAVFGVTLERAGGVAKPTGAMLVQAKVRAV